MINHQLIDDQVRAMATPAYGNGGPDMHEWNRLLTSIDATYVQVFKSSSQVAVNRESIVY